VSRCEAGRPEPGALLALFSLATDARDAALALDGLLAVRLARVARGGREPLPAVAAMRFVRMCAACDAPDVLVEAMYRANELGLMLSNNAVDAALKHFARGGDLGALERIYRAMGPAGVPPDHRTAYCLIRACVAAGRPDRARAFEAEFRERGVPRTKPTAMRLLAAAAAAEGGGGAAGAGDPPPSEI
jgi:hypothetical protein